MPNNNAKHVDSKMIAILFGVTARRVQQLAADGIIDAVQYKPYRFDLLPTIQRYIKYLSDKANGREAGSKKDLEAEGRKLEAEADLKRSKADMLPSSSRSSRGRCTAARTSRTL